MSNSELVEEYGKNRTYWPMNSASGDGQVGTTYLDNNIILGTIFSLNTIHKFTAEALTLEITAEVPEEYQDCFSDSGVIVVPVDIHPTAGYVTLEIYEDAVYTSGTGTLISPDSRNRKKVDAKPCRAELRSDPTITTNGTKLSFDKIYGTESTNQSSGGGPGATSNPVVLDETKIYRLVITASEANSCGLGIEFRGAV
ncbi:MAG: hypothetical protein PQJ59_17010 [Spirochaetales bacterium]|nr:hypothetical protein [Spirochaetales bacterium]